MSESVDRVRGGVGHGAARVSGSGPDTVLVSTPHPFGRGRAWRGAEVPRGDVKRGGSPGSQRNRAGPRPATRQRLVSAWHIRAARLTAVTDEQPDLGDQVCLGLGYEFTIQGVGKSV